MQYSRVPLFSWEGAAEVDSTTLEFSGTATGPFMSVAAFLGMIKQRFNNYALDLNILDQSVEGDIQLTRFAIVDSRAPTVFRGRAMIGIRQVFSGLEGTPRGQHPLVAVEADILARVTARRGGVAEANPYRRYRR
jgi:hypothetical protein